MRKKEEREEGRRKSTHDAANASLDSKQWGMGEQSHRNGCLFIPCRSWKKFPGAMGLSFSIGISGVFCAADIDIGRIWPPIDGVLISMIRELERVGNWPRLAWDNPTRG